MRRGFRGRLRVKGNAERVEELLPGRVCASGARGFEVCCIRVCGFIVREIKRLGGSDWRVWVFGRNDFLGLFLDLRWGNRIRDAFDGWRGRRWRCRHFNRDWGGDLGGGRSVFALLLRGLDEFSVGADFDERILQGGERETFVAKFSKTPHIFSPGPK